MDTLTGALAIEMQDWSDPQPLDVLRLDSYFNQWERAWWEDFDMAELPVRHNLLNRGLGKVLGGSQRYITNPIQPSDSQFSIQGMGMEREKRKGATTSETIDWNGQQPLTLLLAVEDPKDVICAYAG